MKKLISCALILSVLSSTSAIYFAEGEAPIRIDESYRDENDDDILDGFGDELFLTEDDENEQADALEDEDERDSSGFAGKLLTAWNCVTVFLKRHSSFLVIAGINTAITAFEYVVGTETANAIKNLITGCYNLFSLTKGDPVKKAKEELKKATEEVEAKQIEYNNNRMSQDARDALEAAKKKQKEAENNLKEAEKAKSTKDTDDKKLLAEQEKQIDNVVKQNKELYKTNCSWFEKKVKELKTAVEEGDLQTAICHAESAIEAVSNASSATASVKDCALSLSSLAAIMNRSMSVYFIKAISDNANIADAAALATLTSIKKVYDILTTKGLDKVRLKKAFEVLDTKAKDFKDAADIWSKTSTQSSTSTTKTYSWL